MSYIGVHIFFGILLVILEVCIKNHLIFVYFMIFFSNTMFRTTRTYFTYLCNTSKFVDNIIQEICEYEDIKVGKFECLQH